MAELPEDQWLVGLPLLFGFSTTIHYFVWWRGKEVREGYW